MFQDTVEDCGSRSCLSGSARISTKTKQELDSTHIVTSLSFVAPGPARPVSFRVCVWLGLVLHARGPGPYNKQYFPTLAAWRRSFASLSLCFVVSWSRGAEMGSEARASSRAERPPPGGAFRSYSKLIIKECSKTRSKIADLALVCLDLLVSRPKPSKSSTRHTS